VKVTARRRAARHGSLAAFALLLSGCFLIPEAEKDLEAPLVELPEVRYDTIEVTRRSLIRQVSVSGRLVASRQQDLFFREQGGRLVSLPIRPGDGVRQGQVLAEIGVAGLSYQVRLREIAVEKARLRLELLRSSSANRFEVGMAALDVEAAEVQLEESAATLADSRLLAPFSGQVAQVGPEEGDYVEPFRTVARLVDPSRLVMECAADSEETFGIGTLVDVEVRGRRLRGEVVSVPIPEEAKKDERMLIAVTGLPRDAAMGDLAVATLVLERRENAIVVPRYVLHGSAGAMYVNVLDKGERVERDVQTGMETPSEVEILRGLDEGEQVITR
jgi:membrane fusion protein, macrolide-specific efflux system